MAEIAMAAAAEATGAVEAAGARASSELRAQMEAAAAAGEAAAAAARAEQERQWQARLAAETARRAEVFAPSVVALRRRSSVRKVEGEGTGDAVAGTTAQDGEGALGVAASDPTDCGGGVSR